MNAKRREHREQSAQSEFVGGFCDVGTARRLAALAVLRNESKSAVLRSLIHAAPLEVPQTTATPEGARV